jgi:hypothetical protein
MQHAALQTKRLTRSRRARLLATAAVLTGVLVAGCGTSSGSPSTSTGAGATTTAARVASTRTTASGGGSGPLAYSECMRANGVPGFPDPKPGGGIDLSNAPGVNPAAPAFRAAQSKCQKLIGSPPGGPVSLGGTTHPTAQTMAKLRRIAVCMRQHGVPQFPDPQTTVPSNPIASGISEITDFDGAVLLFPSSINMQAPAYRKALTACGAPPLGLHHG